MNIMPCGSIGDALKQLNSGTIKVEEPDK